jgi:hypothetical protein
LRLSACDSRKAQSSRRSEDPSQVAVDSGLHSLDAKECSDVSEYGPARVKRPHELC